MAVRKPVTKAVAHVQLGNDGAKRFYERLGFKEGERCVAIHHFTPSQLSWGFVMHGMKR